MNIGLLSQTSQVFFTAEAQRTPRLRRVLHFLSALPPRAPRLCGQGGSRSFANRYHEFSVSVHHRSRPFEKRGKLHVRWQRPQDQSLFARQARGAKGGGHCWMPVLQQDRRLQRQA